MLSRAQKKNYLENVLLNSSLLEQPFTLFIDIIKDIIVKYDNVYSLNISLLKFTNLAVGKQVSIPKHYIPIVVDLIKIAHNITISKDVSNKISLYQNMLKSDYEILKFMDKEKEIQEEKKKDKKEHENFDILYLTNSDDMIDSLYKRYDLIKLIRSLGIRYTAYYFYFLYELEEYS